jgi:hypothetical protein
MSLDASVMRLVKMGAPLAALFLTNKFVDATNPSVLWAIRVAYFALQAAMLLSYMSVRSSIFRKNDLTSIEVKAKNQPTVTKKKRKGETEAVAMEQTTIRDYDLAQLKSALMQTMMGAVITGGLHLYFGMLPPLVVGCIQVPIAVMDAPLLKAHIMGQDVPRPFSEPEGLMDAFKAEAKDLKDTVTSGAESTKTKVEPDDAQQQFSVLASDSASAASKAEAFRRIRAAGKKSS